MLKPFLHRSTPHVFAMHLQISILILSLIHYAKSGNICYYPNGETMGTDVPCDPDAPFTQCCPSRDTCLSNGLCALQSTDNDSGISYARGTCTDPTWTSPLCPQHCQLNQDTPLNSSAYDFRAGGVQIWECEKQGYGVKAEYCCESQGESQSCCETSSVVFVLESATIGPYTGVESTSSSSSAFSTVSNAATTPSRTASVTQISSGPTATAPVDSANTGSNKSSVIGAGVGGSLGGCVLTAVIILLIRRYRRRASPPVELPVTATEFHDKAMLELPTEEPRLELTSRNQPVWELPAERRLPGQTA